jgi:hypothetical protein
MVQSWEAFLRSPGSVMTLEGFKAHLATQRRAKARLKDVYEKEE